jgi:SAM-dependent methyltransferase
LPAASVDFVVAAQAFHWFDPESTRQEFHRILKPGGYLVLIWNERQLNTTPLLIDYEAFLLEYADDYTKVRHENIDGPALREFFQGEYGRITFQNAQVLDFDGLLGRMLSSSYMPSESDAVFPGMSEELQHIFAKHQESGKINLFYDANVYYSRV